MPLKKGSSRKTVSSNVKELVHNYEKKGSIGNSKPASKKKAVKQAVAIALNKAGKSRTQKVSKTKAAGKSSSRKKASGPSKHQPVKTDPSHAWPKPELVEKEDPVAALVHTPYQLFAPLLEIITTPWRSFMPFTPWPITPTRER